MGKVINATARFRRKGLTQLFLEQKEPDPLDEEIKKLMRKEAEEIIDHMKMAAHNRVEAKRWFERFLKGD